MPSDKKILAFAVVGFLYVFASIFYMLYTYIANYGTPFKDSLSKQQLEIKEREAKRRGRVFLAGIILGMAMLVSTKYKKKSK